MENTATLGYFIVILSVISPCCSDLRFTEDRPAPSCTPPGCEDHVEMHQDRKYTKNPSEFIRLRDAIIQAEKAAKTGGRAVLSPKEAAVNKLLMKFKEAEIKEGRENLKRYPPANHFFHARADIEKSQVYQLIQRMPKGAILHAHEMAIADIHGVITSLTYLPNCYMCFLPDGQLRFHFWDSLPANPECSWKLVNTWRNQSGNARAFDDELYKNMTLVVDDPEEQYPTLDIVWKRFLQLFQTMNGLYYSTVGFKAIVYQGLLETHWDNVQYVEIRTLLSEVYDLDGSVHQQDWVVNAYKEVFEEFVEDTGRDFGGAKIIFTGIRAMDKDIIHTQIKQAVELKKKFPDTLAGYDLVGQEDPGHPLIYFLDDLLEPSQQGVDLPYFFHAGETSWFDEDVGINLIDAILLNTTRIGHGYAITKHPKAMQMARERGIAIEINPISNQVLGLVKDLRNHPAATLISEDFPLVISSDDPGFWGASPLSHDFYLAFMGMGGAWADISTLKQFATDSIKYSAMSGTEKAAVLKLWAAKWETFLDETISLYNLMV